MHLMLLRLTHSDNSGRLLDTVSCIPGNDARAGGALAARSALKLSLNKREDPERLERTVPGSH